MPGVETPHPYSVFYRFLLGGATNTILSYVLYFILLKFLSYRVSYTLAFLFGISLAYILNRYFVFQTSRRLLSIGLFPIVYVVQYLVGLLIVSIWVERIGAPRELAPVAAILVTIPLTFVLTRLVFVDRSR